MPALAQSLLTYLALCTVGTAAGLAVVTAAGPAFTPAQRLMLSPVTCLASWAVVLGGAVALGCPVRDLVAPLWAATLALSARGVWLALRTPARPGRADLLVFGVCVALPIASLWPFFRYGLADWPGSVAPDGWSYVAYAQYLWDHRRFDDGGLAPLYQYAAHLSITRHVSASLLDLLALWTAALTPGVSAGDAQLGVGLLLAWGLFAFGTASAAAATTIELERAWVPGYLVLAVWSGWVANAVYLNAFDNVTVLALFPALVAAVSLAPAGAWRPALHLGLLGAGLLYTYPELAPFVSAAVAALALHRAWRERSPIRGWILTLALAAVCAFALTLPYLRSLVAFIGLQSYNALTVRVGGRVFEGLLSSGRQPSAFWALGGEHGATTFGAWRTALAWLLTLGALAGVWSLTRLRRHGVVFTSALVLAAFAVLTVRHGYAYGAYKVLLMGWWVIALLPVAGATYVLQNARPRSRGVAAGVAALLALACVPLQEGGSLTRDFGRQLQDSMQPARDVRRIAGIVGERGVLLAVDGDWANQWAV
jgi:hypothetical protein